MPSAIWVFNNLNVMLSPIEIHPPVQGPAKNGRPITGPSNPTRKRKPPAGRILKGMMRPAGGLVLEPSSSSGNPDSPGFKPSDDTG